MYPDNSKYKYPGDEDAVEGVDFWYEDAPHSTSGEKVRVTKASGGGTLHHFGGPCGPLYCDENGES